MDSNNKKFWGLTHKTWAILSIIAVCIFIVIPFIFLAVKALINKSSFLDIWVAGVSLLVGAVGTIASVVSIKASQIDKKEQEKINRLLSEFYEVGRIIEKIEFTATQSLEHYKLLETALHENGVIKEKPSKGIIVYNPPSIFDSSWNPKETSAERTENGDCDKVDTSNQSNANSSVKKNSTSNKTSKNKKKKKKK